MTWFKVDDKLWGHPKWMALPAGARALWVTAGSYCASNETDGRLNSAMVQPLGGRTRDADKLVESGLWERVEGGYQFHDWADFQPTKAQVRAERDAVKERQRRWRENRASRRDNGVSNGVTNASRNGVTNGAPTRPDPSSLSSPLSRDQPPVTDQPPPTGGKRDTTPARQLAATLLGLDQTDPKLDQLPQVLRDNGVRSAGPWIRTTANTGDLEALLDAAVEANRDPWAHLPHIGPA